MSALMAQVNERTQLAGTNRFEVLLFSLGKESNGREEIYGINVFKVRQVLRVPPITRTPDAPDGVEGMVALRGVTMPVINLAKYTGVVATEAPQILMVTEYNHQTQGFLVDCVDRIERLA